MTRAPLAIVALILCASCLVAQSPLTTLATPYNSNNGQSGNLFDVVATNDISVHGLDINVDANFGGVGNDIEVYVLDGASWQTDPTNATGNWRLVGSYTGIVSAGADLPTRVGPLSTCVDIPAGTTTAFYVTVTNGTTINYTNGTAVGSVLASNADFTILEGAGLSYPFGGNFQPRNWNGTLYYLPGLTAGMCLPMPPVPGADYQQNGSTFQLDVDGVQSNGFAPAISTALINRSQNINFTGTAGIPWETAFEIGGSLVPNALTIGTDIVNVDLATASYLNGGATLNFQPFTGSFSLPVTLPAPTSIAGQSVFLDPAAATGIALTQGIQAEWAPLPPLPAGPTGDDSFVQAALSFPVDFYGVAYSDISVISNGRVLFGAGVGDTDFSPSVAEALGDEPFVGYWTDLNPSSAGVINLSEPAPNVVQIDWVGVEYFGAPGAAVSFSVILDGNTNTTSITGLSGITANPGTLGGGDAAFLGASIGLLGATDPGPTAFAVGGAGTTAAATDMLYDFNDGLTGMLSPALVGGLNGIDFIGAGPGSGLTWIGN